MIHLASGSRTQPQRGGYDWQASAPRRAGRSSSPRQLALVHVEGPCETKILKLRVASKGRLTKPIYESRLEKLDHVSCLAFGGCPPTDALFPAAPEPSPGRRAL